MTTNPTTAEQALEALDDAENHLLRMSTGHHVDGTMPMNYTEWVGHCLEPHLPAIRAALQSERRKIGDWGDKSKARLPEVSEAVDYGQSEREKADGKVVSQLTPRQFLDYLPFRGKDEGVMTMRIVELMAVDFPNGLKILKE